jgi:hypothetical protein
MEEKLRPGKEDDFHRKNDVEEEEKAVQASFFRCHARPSIYH